MKKRSFKIAVLFCFLVTSLLCAVETNSYRTMGKVTSFEKNGYNLIFGCENGAVKVGFLRDGLVRIHMSPDGAFPEDTLHEGENGPYYVANYDWPGIKMSINEEFDYDLEGDIYKITAGDLVVKIRKNPFKITFCDKSGNILASEKTGIVNAGLGHKGDIVYETMSMADDEHFFGFGAFNNKLDVTGVKMVCYARELENHHHRGGFPTPFFYSSNGYGIFFNNLDDDVTFEMGTVPGQYSFYGSSGKMEGWNMDYYFIYGPKFEKILNTYINITGKPVLPEKWYFGHIQHHCCTWTADGVMKAADKYREMDIPCDVLIMDHQALAKGLKWDVDKGYNNYKQMYDHIDKLGFKTSFSTALFDDIYDWKSYDPTVMSNVDDYWSLHMPRVVDGMDFWRQDNSERSVGYTGKKYFANGYKAHQLFGSLWAKNVFEGMESMGLYGRPVISRGGPIGGHRYILPWPGDTPHGLELLDIDLNYIRGGCLAGYSAISVDLGGFKDRGMGRPLEEQNVVRRVVNLEPFVPISKYQGDGDASSTLPWLLTKQQQDLLRYYLKLRYRTLPYRYSSAIEAHLTGRPLLAPLVFDYQNDQATYDKDFEFLLGRDILVAPVMQRTEQWDVYLPEGKWTHYWTGTVYDGRQTVTVDAPLYGNSSLPMFVKAGAIIPMMPEMNYIYEKKPDPITLDIYPNWASNSQYSMYDCESPKTPLQYTKALFTCTSQADTLTVDISKSSSSYQLSIHCPAKPLEIIVDGKKVKALDSLEKYNKTQKGYYYGNGCFYGNENIVTLNIKVPKSRNEHKIEIKLDEDISKYADVSQAKPISKYAPEKQLTSEPRNHHLGYLVNFSPDDRWLGYDTRTKAGGIGQNTNIEMVNVQTKEVVVVYETSDANEYGPGCGSVDWHPYENKLLFIHGLNNCNSKRPYGFARRRCAVVNVDDPGKVEFLDARDTSWPYTAGAHRGGSHAHQWSEDGKWIGFTYNDDVMTKLEQKTKQTLDLRAVGVMTDSGAIQVKKDAIGENQNGEWTAAIITKVTPEPRPGSDEISRAFSDSWVGTKGYKKPDGKWQRARVFFGNTRDKDGNVLTELFIVDIPDRIDIPGPDGPLQGTATDYMMPPKGTFQRRITFTADRKYPGIDIKTRHWPRSTPNGSTIFFIARDDDGVTQIYSTSPMGGNITQLTHNSSDIQTSFNVSHDGRFICYACDNSIFVTNAEQGDNFGKTTQLTEKNEEQPWYPEFSRNDKMICYNKYVKNGRNKYKQIFITEFNEDRFKQNTL